MAVHDDDDAGELQVDRARILARRRHFIALAMTGVAFAASGGCMPCLSITPIRLKPGGVLVVFVHDQSCAGCRELEKWDLIQAVDGRVVSTAEELEATGLADGQVHTLSVWDHREEVVKTVEFRAKPDPGDPLKRAIPFSFVGAEQIDRAPSWAQRRLWAHASPSLLLVRVDSGERITGLGLHGQRRLIVLFDWGSATDRQNAALTLQVLQKAQADLLDAGVSLIFAHVQHASERVRPPMRDADLHQFFADNQVGASEGGPLPAPPLYRMPNSTEHSAEGGMEGDLSYFKRLGEPPNILVLDERGIIRWHSAGATPDPAGEIGIDMVYTINAAVLFARDQLSA